MVDDITLNDLCEKVEAINPDQKSSRCDLLRDYPLEDQYIIVYGYDHEFRDWVLVPVRREEINKVMDFARYMGCTRIGFADKKTALRKRNKIVCPLWRNRAFDESA